MGTSLVDDGRLGRRCKRGAGTRWVGAHMAIGDVVSQLEPAPHLHTCHRLGMGVDVVEVARFREALARRARMATRLFGAEELAYARLFADPAPRLAARFAAKEAAMKALGVGLGAVAFRDLAVARLASGRPELRVSGRAAELARALGVTEWALSLTHTGLLAAAVVIAIGDPG